MKICLQIIIIISIISITFVEQKGFQNHKSNTFMGIMGNLPANYHHHHHHHHLWLLLFTNTPSVIWDTLHDSPIAKFVVLSIIIIIITSTTITTTERVFFWESSFKTFVQQKPQELKNLRVTLYIYIYIYYKGFSNHHLFTKHPKSLKIGNFFIILLLPKAFQIFMTFVQLKPQELKYPSTK